MCVCVCTHTQPTNRCACDCVFVCRFLSVFVHLHACVWEEENLLSSLYFLLTLLLFPFLPAFYCFKPIFCQWLFIFSRFKPEKTLTKSGLLCLIAFIVRNTAITWFLSELQLPCERVWTLIKILLDTKLNVLKKKNEWKKKNNKWVKMNCAKEARAAAG